MSEISEWGAVAIQEAFRKRKGELAVAEREIDLLKAQLKEAEDRRDHLVTGVNELAGDAKRFGVYLS